MSGFDVKKEEVIDVSDEEEKSEIWDNKDGVSEVDSEEINIS